MRPRKKIGQARPQKQAMISACQQKVLEACAQLPQLCGDIGVLRDYLTEVGRSALQGMLCALVAKDGDTLAVRSLSAEVRGRPDPELIVGQARTFIDRALE